MAEYHTGEHVKYGSSGVCYIEDIRPVELKRGQKRLFYILKPLKNQSATVYVPVENEALVAKMRHILTKDQIDAIILESRKRQVEWNEDRKQRAEEFKAILAQDDVAKLIELVSCIYMKNSELKTEKKKLSSFDDDIYSKAHELIDSEFSFALGISGDEVGAYIRSVLGA